MRHCWFYKGCYGKFRSRTQGGAHNKSNQNAAQGNNYIDDGESSHGSCDKATGISYD